MQGGRRPGTFGNKRTRVLGDHPRHVLGTLESLERLGTTHKCTGYPQMYLHACSPSRLGARYLRIGLLAHYCSRPGRSIMRPSNYETCMTSYMYRLFILVSLFSNRHGTGPSTINTLLPIISYHIPSSHQLIFWGPKGGTLGFGQWNNELINYLFIYLIN